MRYYINTIHLYIYIYTYVHIDIYIKLYIVYRVELITLWEPQLKYRDIRHHRESTRYKEERKLNRKRRGEIEEQNLTDVSERRD